MKSTKTFFQFLITFFFTGIAFCHSSPIDLPDVKYHLTGCPWKSLNISRSSYLDKVEGVVRQTAKFQNAAGAIIDPYEKDEIQYSTPYFAHALGTLISAGRASDILAARVAAMNKATADFATGTSSSTFTYGEFYIAPLTEATALYQPDVSASSSNTLALESYDVRDTVANYFRFVLNGNNINNWNAITEVQFLKQSQVFNTTGAAITFTRTEDSIDIDQGGVKDFLEYISTSDNVPVSARLTAAEGSGGVPTWLSVNGKALNGLPYTTGSEITFTADATNLSLGTYMATVTASAPGYESGQLMIILTVKSGSGGMLTNMKVNFQDSISVPPPGWYKDYGQSFGQRLSSYQGSGQVYGWIRRSDKTPVNLTKNSRKRSNPSSDLLLATLMHMQAGDAPSSSLTDDEGLWEAQVTNGDYDITVSVGDGSYTNSVHALNIEGVKAISDFVPTSSQFFKSAAVTVSVADGLLTIDAIGGKNAKINYIIIKPSASKRPSVVLVNPENGSQNVSENTSISTSVLNLPNGGINNATLTSSNVYLTEENNGAVIPANVNGTGGGDAITLVPSSPLKLSTTYNFTITSGVKDLSGGSFIPYVSQFKTGSGSSVSVLDIKFEKVALANSQGRHSSLTIGPDGKLYALSIDGLIKRFAINQDGTLGAPELLYALQDAYGSRQQRLAIGFAFDPASTAGNLIAWITHSSFIFLNGPSWDGRLTKLSGSNLQNVQDVLINLPRSSKDHVTNSVIFGPDKKLYIVQGSTSAMGRADNTWGNRNETLMSGAMLCLDPAKLGSLPLNIKTSDGGGTYNPYASNAPLTIYASGLRNAYDMLWHSNGKLYVPTNGSAAGGNTPSSVQGTIRPDGSSYNGPAISGLTNVQQSQKDFLFRVEKGGYYGHPNPLRGEYVMNGGNPTTSIDPAQVNDYPVETLPDVNWRSYSFDFQANKSPDGVIEYKSNSFNGALKGKILVVRYSQNDDIMVLTPGGASKDIVSATEGAYIEGFSGFVDPLDLTEDLTKGNIYVSEYGGDGQITLLRPKYDSLPGTAIALNAIADAMIRDGAYATKNYGDDTSLLVKSSPNTGFSRESYLKFSLSGIPKVGKAKLRVYGSNISNSSGVTVGCHGLDNDSWTEQTLTWNTAPASLATVLGSSLVSNQGQYYEFDVTSYVRSQLNGDKVVSLVLKDVNNADKILQFNSKENPQNRPQLIIITDSVGGSTGVTTFNTLADASVRDGSYSSKNYGSDGTLLIKGSPNAGFTRHTYLRFGLTGLTTVGTAKVRIYGSNTSGSKPVTVTGYGVDNDSWSENSINWNTAPPAQGTAQGEVVVTNQKQYYEIDVTGYVKSQLSGDKVVSLLLKDGGNADNILEFNSKENGQYPPQLVVTDGSQTLTTYSQNTAPAEAYQDTTSRSAAYSMEEAEISKHDFEKPRVYPNPLHSKFNLEFPASYLGNYNVQILDGNGRLYLSENVRIRPGGFNLVLNISQLKLKQGIYFLKVSNDKGTKDSFKLFVY